MQNNDAKWRCNKTMQNNDAKWQCHRIIGVGGYGLRCSLIGEGVVEGASRLQHACRELYKGIGALCVGQAPTAMRQKGWEWLFKCFRIAACVQKAVQGKSCMFWRAGTDCDATDEGCGEFERVLMRKKRWKFCGRRCRLIPWKRRGKYLVIINAANEHI